jgi:predicted metal-binding protein
MPVVQVEPVYDPKVRGLCARSYYNHPKGCPNLGKKPGCPPEAPKLPEVFELKRPSYLIYNVFDFGSHVAKMRVKHPTWTQRQLECCLYWQTRARHQLYRLLAEFKREHPGLLYTCCPEAMGLNVTETLANVGVAIEWPPVNVTLQVAFAGVPKDVSAK